MTIKILLALLFGLIFTLNVSSFPGDLDPTFDHTGRRQLSFGRGAGGGDAVALQNDGKLVMASFCTNGGDYGSDNLDLCVSRFDPSGAVDPTFGENGTVITTTTTEWGIDGTSVAIQSDGKIVVAGYARKGALFAPANEFRMVFIRYNSDGSLDNTFGDGGKVLNLFPDLQHAVVSMSIQPDGKIVAAGSIWPVDGNVSAMVVRLNENGTLDESFGTGGLVSLGFGAGTSSLRSIIFQNDGRLVVAGGYGDSVAAARLLPDGSFDAGFGTNGKVVVPFDTYQAGSVGAALQPDGKLVIAGDLFGAYDTYRIALTRLGTDGNLDTTFNGNGKVIWGIPNRRERATGVTVNSDGITVVGSDEWNGRRLLLLRLRLSGEVDTTFNSYGFVRLQTRGETGGAAIVEQSDGEYIISGGNAEANGPVLFRFNRWGRLDPFFGNRGMAVAQVGREKSEATSMAIQPDGKIVVAGSTGSAGNVQQRAAIVRFLPDGTFDPGFGDDGKLILNIGSASTLQSICLLPDGKIIGAGYTYFQPQRNPFLIRLDSQGRPDPSFGNNGIVRSELDGVLVVAIAAQSDGKIVLLGGNPYQDFLVARYDPDGSLDTSFDGDGYKTFSFRAYSQEPFALTLQPDGKMIVCGYTYDYDPSTNYNSSNAVLARLNANGSFDLSFGRHGTIVTDFDRFDTATTVTVLSNGKILTGGSSGFWGALVRYNSNGSLDTTFGIGGRALADNVGFFGLRALVLQPNGQIVATGNSWNYGFGVVRFNADGSVDQTGFGTDGVASVDFGNRVNGGRAVALDSNGRIVAAGTGGGLFGVVRLQGNNATTQIYSPFRVRSE